MPKNPHAVELGRLGGQAKSDRKTQAVRENGKKGGRPRKPDQASAPRGKDPSASRGG